MPTLPSRRNSLTLSNFDRSLRADIRTCDLSQVTFMDAYGLVGTACALHAAIEEGHDPLIRIPSQEPMCKHLALMGFGDLLEELGCASELPELEAPNRPDVLVPVQKVNGHIAESRLSHLLWEQLRRHADPDVLEATVEGLWELVANALEHSGSEAIVMGHVYSRGEPPHHDQKVQVVIGDSGKGIRRSFLESGRHQPRDDREAIVDLALEYLVTSVDDPGRGQGLFTTMEQMVALDGTLVVRSGTAKISVGSGARQDEGVPFLPGTIVCMSLPLYPGKPHGHP